MISRDCIITVNGNIAKFTTFCIKSPSSSPATFLPTIYV